MSPLRDSRAYQAAEEIMTKLTYVRLLCAPCSKRYEIVQGERPICPRCNGALRVVSARVG